jgi:hypothetical protein
VFHKALRTLAQGLTDDGAHTQDYWQPDERNEPQCLAYKLADEVDEMGFGGQGGGGKSDLALGLAGTKFHRSLIIRREFKSLRRLIERGNEIYPSQFIAGDKSEWRFLNRSITLASTPNEKDWRKYQGWDSDLLVFDEAAENLEPIVRNISGWIRTSTGRHTLLLLLFNPPTTAEGEWIVRKFAPWVDPSYAGTPAKSGEIRYFVTLDEGREIEVDHPDLYTHEDGKEYPPIRRTFIKASRHDNPYLDDEYERRLAALPEPLRSQVRDGDFTVGMKDSEWQVIPTSWVLMAQERGRQEKRPALNLRAVGVDPAHGGEDRTTIGKLYGNWMELLEFPGSETPEGKHVAHKVHLAMDGAKDVAVGVDAIGYGASAAERMQDDYQMNVLKINSSERSDGTDKSDTYGFANLRSEMYWRLREALDPENMEALALPDDRDIRVELCAPTYKIRGGRYVVESKEDIKKRLGRSPDKADVVVYTWYTAIHTRIQLWVF